MSDNNNIVALCYPAIYYIINTIYYTLSSRYIVLHITKPSREDLKTIMRRSWRMWVAQFTEMFLGWQFLLLLLLPGGAE